MQPSRNPLLQIVEGLRRDELAVVGAAIASFAVIVFLSNGIPYGLDGNETFSSIVHAINFLNFDFSHARGLADETLSREVAAHSFVHTHQGNFPRVFATLLYALDIKSPEGQVIATAAFIGVPSVLLWYRFVDRTMGRVGALVSVGLLLTDYALFLQTQLVTYRAWQFFFIAVSFYCVQRLIDTGRARWNVVLFFLFVCLFYYELLFATFVATSASLWAIWNLRDRPSEAVRTVAICFAGAVAGVAIFVLQAIWLLGWDGMVRDLFGTVLARNSSGDVAAQLAEMKAWLDANRIVFFMNLIDGNLYRNLDWVVRAFTTYGFLVYSPIVFVLIAQWCGGAAVSLAKPSGWLGSPDANPVLWPAVGAVLLLVPGPTTILLCGAGIAIWCYFRQRAAPNRVHDWMSTGSRTSLLWVIWYAALLMDDRALGGAPSLGISIAPLIAAAALGLASAFTVPYLLGIVGIRSQAPGRISVLLLGFIAAVGLSGVHSDPTATAFWIQTFGGSGFGRFGVKILIAFSALATVCLAVKAPAPGAGRSLQREDAGDAGFWVFVLCVFCGLVVVDLLLPGYLYSGYLVRYCVFLPPFLGVIASYGFVWFVRTSLGAFHALDTRIRRIGMAGLGTATCALAVWMVVQVSMLSLIPPGEFAGLFAALRKLPGATLAANSYAAPFYVATGANLHDGWGYIDEKLGRADVKQDDTGFDYVRDPKYLWFADRLTNGKYARPSIFICLMGRGIGEQMHKRMTGAPGSSCRDMRMISYAFEPTRETFPAPKLIAADSSGGRKWAVVAIDYDFPPFLERLPTARVATQDRQIVVDVEYAFRHQDGTAEGESVIELVSLGGLDSACGRRNARVMVTAKGYKGRARLLLPSSQSLGPEFFVAGVRPATRTRVGQAVYSQPFRSDGQPIELASLGCKGSKEAELK